VRAAGPEKEWGVGGQAFEGLHRSSGRAGSLVAGQPGDPRRTTILLLAFIVVAGVAIGALTYLALGDRRSAPPPPVTSSAPPSRAQTMTPDSAVPPSTVTVSVPAPPSTTSITVAPPAALPTQPRASVWTGVVVGTCDEQGTCGVQQRNAPYNSAARLDPNDLKDGMSVRLVCQTPGDLRTNGGYGTSYWWYRLVNGAYVNSVYVSTQASGIPVC